MKNALEVTYGCMVYQEQVMQIVRDVAGYSLGRSDIMRRAMSKKDKNAMDFERQVFIYGLEEDGKVIVDGAVKRGIEEKTAIAIFDKIAAFAQYAFNKSHAAAYAVVAYQTAFLKCYYPLEFMAAMLNSLLGDAAKTARYVGYCREHGISVLPPDVNKSLSGFSPVKGDNAIRFGLSAVKNVGISGVEAIVKERDKNGEFSSLDDFAQRTADFSDVNKRMVESLIKAGAFDFTGFSRRSLINCYEAVLDGAAQRNKNSLSGQFSMFDSLSPEDNIQIETVKEIGEFSRMQFLTQEKEMLGIYLSGHPLENYKTNKNDFDLSKLNTEIDENGDAVLTDEVLAYDNKDVTFVGIISSVRKKATKNGSMMAFLTIEDMYSSIVGLVFPASLQNYGRLIFEDSVVRVFGKLSVRDDDQPAIIVNKLADASEQETALYLRINEDNAGRLSELKQILTDNPGKAKVILFYPKQHSKQEITDGINLSAELEQRLGDIFGKENVKTAQG